MLRSLLSLCVLLASLLLPASPAAAAVPAKPKVMHLNVAGGEWWKGTKQPLISSVAATARQVQPDVISLSELCYDQFTALRDALKPLDANGWQIKDWGFVTETSSVKYTRCLGLNGVNEPCYAAGTCHLAIGSAILTRYDATDGTTWDLPSFVRSDDVRYKLYCVRTWLPVETSPLRLQYSQACTTHLDPVGGVVDPARMAGGWYSFCLPKTADFAGEDIRHCQASVIRARIEENLMVPDANNHYAPLVLAGDMNNRLDEPAFTSDPATQQRAAQVQAWRNYFGFSDFQLPGTVPLKFHFREAGAAANLPTFCHVLGVPANALPPTTVACDPNAREVKIDDVLFQAEYWDSPSEAVAVQYRTPGVPSSGLLSDHRRLDATLTWKPLP
ncbi:endonuclease/exonuclease/phosphatase family protein [Nonomuraea sp. NPDC050556]|uniref:endonuclease/exonuclease/phosphatase family protein n=1 Tax=Nonomuraea sp. NPDC050556 TaxID=3364369 RepID=UPI0037A3CA65